MAIGLQVTAKQIPYPFELSTKELITHKAQIDDYKEELSSNLYQTALNYQPDLKLISQQPEIKEYLRGPILEFLLKISIKTKVTNGIFLQAVKLFDRYCSKRIVLREQVQLVLATCLWLSAKTYGGCNHIINNTNVPPGGRFHGPAPRSRVPRLFELVQLCGGPHDTANGTTNGYDEGMFTQMERHILDTLNWDVCEPQLNNWLYNFYENNYIQLSMNNYENAFKEKLEVLNIKRFLAEVSLFELKLIELHPAVLSTVIFNILSNFYPDSNFCSDLIIPNDLCSSDQSQRYENLLLDKVLNLSDFTLGHYSQLEGVKQFYQSLITSIIKRDSSHLLTPASKSNHSSHSPASSISTINSMAQTPLIKINTNHSPLTTPQHYNNSPISAKAPKRPFFPTPPTSRRGSPAGILDNLNKKSSSTSSQHQTDFPPFSLTSSTMV